MVHRCKISVAVLFAVAPLVWGQSVDSLQKHYDDAQMFQQSGKLTEASQQYHAFLADALTQLGMGYSLARDYKKAAAAFNDALSLEPGSTSLLLDSARTSLMLGNLDKVKSLGTEVIQNHPGNHSQLAEAHQLLGRALLHQDQDREARKELGAAVMLDPTFPNGYDLAISCLDLEDEKCATQIFSEMEKSFGDTPELHLAFGRAYGESDFQPRAVAEFQRAIQEDPHLPEAHYLLAAALLGTGGSQAEVEQAVAALKQELLISPHSAQAYAALGKLEANANHYSEAEEHLKRAIALDPQNPDACLFLGQMYFSQRKYSEAEPYLRRSIQLTTDASRNRYQIQRAHFLLGRILMQRGDRNAAQKEMQVSRGLANKALSQDRTELAALLGTNASPKIAASEPEISIGSSLIDPKALSRVEALAAQWKPAIADSYNNLGAIAATNSDYSAAVNYFKQAAAWNPSMPGLDYNLGRAAFAASRFGDAVSPLSRYVEAHPTDSGARSVLGISQFKVGNYKGCIDALQPVADQSGLAPQAQYVYAESLVRTGHLNAGIARLRTLDNAHPGIPDVQRALAEALRKP